jgi:hypothetical protein
MKETTERATHRMQEFKELVRQADERRKERPVGPRTAPPAPAVRYDFYLREDGLLWPHTADADAWVTATNGFPRYAKGVVIPPAERDRIVQVLRADGFTVGVG